MYCLLLLICTQCYSAADTTLPLQIIKTIPGDYSNFYADNLQNVYVVSATTNQVKKLNANGDSAGVFNNVTRYGKVYSLDVSNPLKILLYYKDFATILVLDRFLNTRSVIDLRKLGIMQVKAIAQSYDNNIWIYDELEGKIKKIDEGNNLLLESVDLRQVLDNDSLNPTKLIDNNGQLYLYDAKAGWLIFDYYMALKKQVAFTNWSNVQARDNHLTGREGNKIHYAMQNDFDYKTKTLAVSLDDATKSQFQDNRFFVLNKEGLVVYDASFLQKP